MHTEIQALILEIRDAGKGTPELERALQTIEHRPFILKVRSLLLLLQSAGLLLLHFCLPGIGGELIIGLPIIPNAFLVMRDIRLLRSARRLVRERIPEARVV